MKPDPVAPIMPFFMVAWVTLAIGSRVGSCTRPSVDERRLWHRAHRDRFRRVIRTVSHVHDTRVASAIGPAHISSVPHPYYLSESSFYSSFYVLLRCVRQDVTFA